MKLFLIICVLLSIMTGLYFIIKSYLTSKYYYKKQYEAIESRKTDFEKEYLSKKNHSTLDSQINYKKNDIITDIIALSFVSESFEYMNIAQSEYIKKIKHLLYVDMMAFSTSFINDYKHEQSLNKRKNVKRILGDIETKMIDPLRAQYEVYKEVKNVKNTIDKKTLSLMKIIERKEVKQREQINEIFKGYYKKKVKTV